MKQTNRVHKPVILIDSADYAKTHDYIMKFHSRSLKDVTDNVICEKYRETSSPMYFAEMYSRMEALIFCAINDLKYSWYGFDLCDRISAALIALDNCMLKYDASIKSKFSTAFTTYLFRQLYCASAPYNRYSCRRLSKDNMVLIAGVSPDSSDSEDGNMGLTWEYVGKFVDKAEIQSPAIKSDLECSISNLPLSNYQRTIITMVSDGCSNIKIAKQLNTTTADIKKEYKEIRKIFINNGISKEVLANV